MTYTNLQNEMQGVCGLNGAEVNTMLKGHYGWFDAPIIPFIVLNSCPFHNIIQYPNNIIQYHHWLISNTSWRFMYFMKTWISIPLCSIVNLIVFNRYHIRTARRFSPLSHYCHGMMKCSNIPYVFFFFLCCCSTIAHSMYICI